MIGRDDIGLLFVSIGCLPISKSQQFGILLLARDLNQHFKRTFGHDFGITSIVWDFAENVQMGVGQNKKADDEGKKKD